MSMHFTEIPLAIVGMMLFVVTFVAVTVASFLLRNNHNEMAQMPLREDEEITYERR